MEMRNSHDALTKYQLLKYKRNSFFMTKDDHMAISKYDKSFQYICVVVP